jgi:hypothetical protein
MGIAGIRVMHVIPGRLRLKIAQVRDNPDLARELYERLSGRRGIQRVEANALTGSVLVLYDAEEITSLESLLALAETLTPLFPELDIREIEKWLTPSGNGSGSNVSLAGGITTAIGALNAGVGKVTGGIDLKLLLPLILFVFGIRGLLVAQKVVFPAWYDLLWFSFATFLMLNRSETRGVQ